MFTDLVKSIDTDNFIDALNELLEYEFAIRSKKLNNEKLTKDEYIFDTYFIQPSFLYRHLKNYRKDYTDEES